jgi:plastocyanin
MGHLEIDMKSMLLAGQGLAFVVGFVLVQNAVAGEINGRIPGWPSNDAVPAVVWVQGPKAPAVPREKPAVVQHKGEFNPKFLVVVVGQTVVMPNQDEVAHNVFSTSQAKSFNLGYYATGDHKEVTFEQPGLVELACSIHNFMRGRILVVPNPYFAQVKADGTFRIRNVPAGNYLLKFWSNDGRQVERRVAVPARGDAMVELDLAAAYRTAMK